MLPTVPCSNIVWEGGRLAEVLHCSLPTAYVPPCHSPLPRADGSALRSVLLAGMGPKLLVSDVSTAHQPVLRWQLRVHGNTAVEFGVIPADLPVRTAGSLGAAWVRPASSARCGWWEAKQ